MPRESSHVCPRCKPDPPLKRCKRCKHCRPSARRLSVPYAPGSRRRTSAATGPSQRLEELVNQHGGAIAEQMGLSVDEVRPVLLRMR